MNVFDPTTVLMIAVVAVACLVLLYLAISSPVKETGLVETVERESVVIELPVAEPETRPGFWRRFVNRFRHRPAEEQPEAEVPEAAEEAAEAAAPAEAGRLDQGEIARLREELTLANQDKERLRDERDLAIFEHQTAVLMAGRCQNELALAQEETRRFRKEAEGWEVLRQQQAEQIISLRAEVDQLPWMLSAETLRTWLGNFAARLSRSDVKRFVQDLTLVAKKTEDKDLAWLSDNLGRIGYVAVEGRTPAAASLTGVEHVAEIMAVITSLQLEIADRLVGLGIASIYPDSGSEVDERHHEVGEGAILTRDPDLDGRIANVWRAGFVVEGEVRRQAGVKLFRLPREENPPAKAGEDNPPETGP